MAEAALRIQPNTRPDVISYSCTSGSIVIGEARIMAEIRAGAPWAIPMTLVTGVVDALRELGARKLVVGTPNRDEINTQESRLLHEKGFEVVEYPLHDRQTPDASDHMVSILPVSDGYGAVISR